MRRPLSKSLLIQLVAIFILTVFAVFIWLSKVDAGGLATLGYDGEVGRMRAKTKSNITKLIILGYKHGGSSFTGGVVDSHPDVFYLYEPVWYVKDPDDFGIAISDQRYSLRDRVKLEWKDMIDLPEPLDFVRSIFRCESMNLITNLGPYWWFSGREVQQMGNCVRRQSREGKIDGGCVEVARHSCLRARVKAIKTVRMSMQEAGQLLSQDKDIKVLYVVRDPRGNINSRTEGKWYSNQEDRPRINPYILKSFIRQCQIMMDDIQTVEQISSKFGDRIVTIRYEDLAENPLRMAPRIFRLLDLEMTPEAMQGLQKLLTPEQQEYVPTKLKRTDSFTTAIKWRRQIPFEMAQKIEQNCSSFIEKMGYRKFQTENEMKDFKIELRQKVSVPTLVLP